MQDPRVHTKSLSQSCNRPPPISSSTDTSPPAAHADMAPPSVGVWALGHERPGAVSPGRGVVLTDLHAMKFSSSSFHVDFANIVGTSFAL